MAKFLDSTGISHLVGQLKNIFALKATTLTGYGITNGVTGVSSTGSGDAVTAASVSGHTLALTKGGTLPSVRRETPASSTTQVTGLTFTETLILNLASISYAAQNKFWVYLKNSEITRGYGFYQGTVITGANTCIVKFGGIASIVGEQVLQAQSAYHFRLATYGKSGSNLAKGYLLWERIGAA